MKKYQDLKCCIFAGIQQPSLALIGSWWKTETLKTNKRDGYANTADDV